MKRIVLIALVGCGGNNNNGDTDAASDSADGSADAAMPDAPTVNPLGTVSNVMDLSACPAGAPSGAACKKLTVSGCAGLETESIDATLAIITPNQTPIGTIVGFSGGGGEGFQSLGSQQYKQAKFTQVIVAWATDWEQTTALGIKAAACRPATVIDWVFHEPTLQNASTANAFCGQGFSGGSGQLGYALAEYGLASELDYVNELSGPPFARIDLGCDSSQPATAMVCGDTVTMRLPSMVDMWENTTTCNMGTAAAGDLAKWTADSIISTGATFDYPKTRVEFFDCTNNATAVTAMAQLYHDQITTDKAYHCYTGADGCNGEGLGTGNADAINAMTAGCVPRHQ